MRITLLLLMFLVTASLVTAQTASKVHPDVSSIVGRMKSQSWTERSKASSDAASLLYSGKATPRDVDQLKLGNIQLLATENNDKTPVDESESEEYSAYYSGLVGFVAGLSDERAIPALLAATNTGGMAIRGVAVFGKKALDPTLEQVNGREPKLAYGALYVLQQMLEMRTVSDTDSHLRIRNAVRSSLRSPHSGVREAAIYVIEYLDDREEFVSMLSEVAEHDPFKLPGVPDDGGDDGVFYPVRQDARRLLHKIAAHTLPVIERSASD